MNISDELINALVEALYSDMKEYIVAEAEQHEKVIQES